MNFITMGQGHQKVSFKKMLSSFITEPHTFLALLKRIMTEIILDILKRSGGMALAVTDTEIMDALLHWARVEGVFAAPEGAAALAAYRKLREREFFGPDDRVVLFNTGTGLKYLDVIDAGRRPAVTKRPASRHIGGIIGPY